MTPTYFTNDQHSLPKAIMAYANDAVFKDEFWNVFDKSNDQWELVHIGMARKRGCEETNNISYQTERVTAAFKDGAIDVDIFMDTPMQELTKFKDKNLRIAAASNSQIKLKSKKYYVSEGKKTLSLARHPHGQAHRQGCPRHRGSANLQSADPQPDSGNGDEKVAIVFVGNLHFA